MLGIFLTIGHPSIEKSIQALNVLHEEQVDLIELGVPFSDPLMDGPVIQKSSHEALDNGVNLDKIFEILSEAKKDPSYQKDQDSSFIQAKGLNNLVLFSAYNPLHVYGFDKLIKKCVEHNIKSVLIPDLPLDESEEVRDKFDKHGIGLVLLVAPTSTHERKEKICKISNPFIYLVSRVGTTGGGENFDQNEELKGIIKELKANTKHPIAVGFGIDKGEKVKQVLGMNADIAIVGSKAVKVLSEDQSADLSEFRNFIKDLKQGTIS